MYNINYGDDRNRHKYPSWSRPTSRQQVQARSGERLWVEISDDEEGMCLEPSVFKSGGSKSHPQATPPLDLSVIEQSNPKGSRQAESPLDLSVKTRKRCADTTEYDDLHMRQSHITDASMTKRSRLAQSQGEEGHKQQGYTQEPRSIPSQLEYEQRQFMHDPMTRNKMLQQQMATRAYPTISPRPSSQSQSQPQPSPMSISQQQYSNIQKQHQLSQHSRQMQQLPQGQYNPAHFDPHRSHTQTIHKQKSVYEPVVNNLPRPVQSNASETVALQGFFEPVHKVTVNTNSAIPISTFQHNPSRIDQEQTLRPSSSKSMYASARPRDITSHEQQRGHTTFVRGATYPMGANARMSRPTMSHHVPKSTELDLLQQKQMEQQRQLAKKDQMSYMSQKAIIMTTPESQQMSQMMDLFKQSEQSHVQSLTKSQHSPYTQNMPTSYTTSATHGGIRQDETYSTARYIRAAQPIPLSDLNQRQLALEEAHVIQNQRNSVVSQSGPDSSRYVSQHLPILDPSQRSPIEQNRMSAERERRYVMNENLERTMSYAQRNDPVVSMNMDLHPSVIQRPQGFIPPRIVSGRGRPSNFVQTNASANSGDVSGPQSRYSSLERIQLSAASTLSDVSQNKRVQELSALSTTKSRPLQYENRRIVGDPRQQPVVDFRREYTSSSQQSLTRGKQKLDIAQHNAMSRRPLQGESIPRGIIPRSSQNNRSIPSELTRGREQQKTMTETITTSLIAMPVVRQTSSERSITKGTSGISSKSSSQDVDVFSQFVMNELKRPDDDKTVNPFANRSLLQEFDRSINSSPVRQSDLHGNSKERNPEHNKNGSKGSNVKEPSTSPLPKTPESTSYTLPLQIAIPGSKSGISVASSAPRTSVVASSKPEYTVSSNPKIMSRKHMILRAFKQDEDLKNTVNIDQDEKVPIESAKFVAKRAEKESSQSFPPSPKMPILSPQEKNRATPVMSPAIREPPHLEDIALSNSVTKSSTQEKSKSEINSLEEHLHKLISDAVKGSVHKDKESVYETVCRELNTQPQGHKVFLTRQLSQTRNIPIANVAPIVHDKHKPDSNNDGNTKDNKLGHELELDEEDKKMAEVITRSLLGRSRVPERTVEKLKDEAKPKRVENDQETIADIRSNKEGECSNMSIPDFHNENVFDENSNSKRMSPGLKKLMLYRHRDVAEASKELELSGHENKSDGLLGRTSETLLPWDSDKPDRQSEKQRNVFGAFSEILAQKSGPNDNEGEPCWQGVNDEEEHEISLVPNCDYDGDEEDNREHPKIRRSRQSSVRQQADRLIKKARHRRNSKGEGCLLGRGGLARRRHPSYKGFVDFTPQVLPRRTRSRVPGKSPPRRKSRVGKHIDSPVRHKRRSSSQEIRDSDKVVKTRQRRASSLDRETKSRQTKAKCKSVSFSDNELDCGRLSSKAESSAAGTWKHDDESTDEEYFQNYEDNFKHFIRNSDASSLNIKKVQSVKKKKGFHFKQKYIFQRKRKAKGRGKPLDLETLPDVQSLDEIYSFHEEAQDDLLPYPCGTGVLGAISDIPVPPEVKRVTVNKDTGETLLHRAARMGQEEVALYCLATGTVDVNARDNARYTALHECAVRGRLKIAKHLLKHGADVNCCSVDGIRPIHDAVENDQMEILRLLLAYGADPTLSTYAGRTLMKIARTDRMRNYLQAYNSDLNGYSSASEEIPWQFRASSTSIEPEDNYGCAICNDLPSDPDDESYDMCILSTKPLFSTHRFASEPGKRVEDYILLDDILSSYHATRTDLASLGGSHLIKNIPVKTLTDSHSHTINMEYLLGKGDQGSIPAIRIVDSTQIIAKLEKQTQTCTKRTKI